MASTIYQGKNLRFKFGGKALFHATSCSIDISTTLEEIATKDTNGSVSTPGNYSWGISADALVANLPSGNSTHVDFAYLLDAQLANTEIEVDFTTSETGDFIYSGTVYIESSNIQAEVGSSAKGSFSFKGNGNLTKTTVP